jgi:shikimate dehydrogenase
MTAKAYAEVIGDPIAQSKSPLIHRFWLDALGIDAEYRKTHVRPEDLAAFVALRRDDPDWRGCNVTVPHKIAALDLIEDRGDVRASIGAINTILPIEEDGARTLVGTNTDAAGFFAPLAEVDLAGAAVTIVGSGGAARAVLFALTRMAVGKVTLLARNPLKGAGLLAQFGLKGEALPIPRAAPPSALLVNTTTLGMVGEPPLELDLGALPDDALVYDIVYAPIETPLLRAARARELATIDGLEMLVGQAAVAFELFFGQAPPRDRDEELRALVLA